MLLQTRDDVNIPMANYHIPSLALIFPIRPLELFCDSHNWFKFATWTKEIETMLICYLGTSVCLCMMKGKNNY